MQSGKWRHLLYLIGALSMLVYAAPKLEFGLPWTAAAVFGTAWTALAVIVIAANVWALLDLNERTKKRLARVKRAKALQWQRAMDRATLPRRAKN
ncbi:hypothetical protein [Paenibacillus beijingensis]|uniref:Uncharacterized protein n=1 Tax=Paenibacillus beijingensis TaxID=1126833 RepID=A0A0D5NL37_9BACL|nr:hypothetical protein [Paenibacillus beijingensis]AJY75981.1 hypothetical protein VN24_17260 [Paenibacillus beijingensis]